MVTIPPISVMFLNDGRYKVIRKLGQWETSPLYITPERKLFNCQLGGVPDGGEPLLLDEPAMEKAFDQAKPEIDTEEADTVKALVRRILQYDLAKRPSATEILADPWCYEGG